MKMCDRCPGAGGCLLNYNGKACQNWRVKNAPDVVYTNVDRIRAMRIEELAIFLANESFRIVGAALDAYGVKMEDKNMEELYNIGISRRVVWLLSTAEDSEDEE